MRLASVASLLAASAYMVVVDRVKWLGAKEPRVSKWTRSRSGETRFGGVRFRARGRHNRTSANPLLLSLTSLPHHVALAACWMR